VIEQLIRRAGLHRNKARYIKDCARLILERHDGRVPDTLKELVALPGVGRKTANVVLGAAFGIPAVAVDTHVARIAMRLGLTAHTDPVKIEVDLMEKIPKPEWNAFCLRLVYFGRQTCTARKPACPVCRLKGLCPYFHKTEASAGND